MGWLLSIIMLISAYITNNDIYWILAGLFAIAGSISVGCKYIENGLIESGRRKNNKED